MVKVRHPSVTYILRRLWQMPKTRISPPRLLTTAANSLTSDSCYAVFASHRLRFQCRFILTVFEFSVKFNIQIHIIMQQGLIRVFVLNGISFKGLQGYTMQQAACLKILRNRLTPLTANCKTANCVTANFIIANCMTANFITTKDMIAYLMTANGMLSMPLLMQMIGFGQLILIMDDWFATILVDKQVAV